MFESALSIMIFLPILVGVLLLFPLFKDGSRIIGFTVSLLVLLMGLQLFLDFDGQQGLQFVVHREWIQRLGISYGLGVDGISLLVLMTSAVLFPLVFCVLKEQKRALYGNLLICQGAMIGAICATDMVLFYIFWEIMLLPIFFTIGLFGGSNRLPATLKITIYTIAGSLLMLVALIYVAVSYHSQTGVWSFDMAQLASLNLGDGFAGLAFVMFMIAFAIKIPIFPFHTWLPDAYTEAPPATTFVLSAIMAKIGVYGVIRLVLPVFAPEFAGWATFLMLLGIIGMVYCGIAAIGQKDMKRMLAFSSASHMGIIAVGVFAMNAQALAGSIFQIAAHATSTGVLFLFVGLMEERLQTREIEALGGIAYRAPIFATFFAVAMLASVGLPGTSGFIGEFLIILGAVKYSTFLGALAGTTLIVGVCYMLWMFQRVFFEKENAVSAKFADLGAVEAFSFLPVIVLILVMGIFPNVFLSKIEPSVEKVIARLYTDQAMVQETAQVITNKAVPSLTINN
ncbi:MAG: NADH-quinone oxidoreductase subunit M [Deltaproteobacteria bacterium]|nr:MAG: NADH-quinone oxidoreductase subunit M [Deltaproteobacteria bacterium]